MCYPARNSAPAGQKTECSNCGATHTPMAKWLNDELKCNACGLYRKLVSVSKAVVPQADAIRAQHKRPRPKSNAQCALCTMTPHEVVILDV